MCAFGRRPICQDTGVANVFLKVGMGARIDSRRSLQAIVDDAVRDAYRAADNPLRASMVRDPLFDRRNTGDNSPGIVSVDLVEGDSIEVDVSAKGGGSENKARFTVLDPGESVADWVVSPSKSWVPAGVRRVFSASGRGGADKAMLLAKEALNEPLDMTEFIARGPATPEEALRRRDLQSRQRARHRRPGPGGMTAVLDVKLRTFPAHAASLPVGADPNCAATRHVHFRSMAAVPPSSNRPI